MFWSFLGREILSIFAQAFLEAWTQPAQIEAIRLAAIFAHQETLKARQLLIAAEQERDALKARIASDFKRGFRNQ